MMKFSMKHGFCLLAGLFLCATVQADSATEQTGEQVPCPSQNFDNFFRAFRESEEVRRAFTRNPLKTSKFDFSVNVNGKAKIVSTMVDQREIDLSIVSGKDFSSMAFDDSDKSVRVYLEKIDFNDPKEIIYHFSKNDGCWKLSSIEDRTLMSEDGKLIPDWIDWLFVPIYRSLCGPTQFYYDVKNKRTNRGYMEQRGYVPDEVDEEIARYKNMREKFHGFDVVEMEIPSEYNVRFVVAVSASTEDLSKAILKETGQKIPVVQPGYKEKLGKAYIVPKERISLFVCPFPETKELYFFDECDPSHPSYKEGISCKFPNEE
jgi:hypothetical protein